MRQDINILWLDDELSSSAHEERKEIVSGILEDKGYRAVVKECSTFVEAEKELSSVKRYDFFISDFNLDNKETGLTYLEKIREVNGYKQFVILYSNNEYSTIKREIIEVVKEKRINPSCERPNILILKPKTININPKLLPIFTTGTNPFLNLKRVELENFWSTWPNSWATTAISAIDDFIDSVEIDTAFLDGSKWSERAGPCTIISTGNLFLSLIISAASFPVKLVPGNLAEFLAYEDLIHICEIMERIKIGIAYKMYEES